MHGVWLQGDHAIDSLKLLINQSAEHLLSPINQGAFSTFLPKREGNFARSYPFENHIEKWISYPACTDLSDKTLIFRRFLIWQGEC